ncbi:hypothetical protein [Aliarcobacter butzleri]|uniref:hypothetical protein n=1 Tax=Aliarcobacter butzleri TaxID=28197 RepID=UPI0021B21009|nr:hypothetical protein [Aliarcobacter butzleri]MCT7647530.1 hypothetical protein [Aliarcobacter butzleri]
MTTNTNTTRMIDEERFFKCVAPFLFTQEQLIPEMIENAIRAKSSYIKIEAKENNLVLENNGQVLSDFSNLFVVAQSNYDIDIEKTQKPAGMGILSIISKSTEITFASGNKVVTVNSHLYFNDADYRSKLMASIIETEDFIDGLKITATLKKPVDTYLATSLNEDFKFYDIDILFNDEKIETKTPIEYLFSKEISKGVILGIPKKQLGNIYHSRNTDGYVIWHGKLISAPQIKPFTLVVNGETNLVSPVLPNRSGITIGIDEGKELATYFENLISDEIQKFIDENKSFFEIQKLLPFLSKEYSLEKLSIYYNCIKKEQNVTYFDANKLVSIAVNSENTIINPIIIDNDNFKFVCLNIGKSKAPSWVLDRIKDCSIEIEISEKAEKAYSYYEHRDQFIIVDSIKVNGVEVDGILDDCDKNLYFTQDFNYSNFISEYCDSYTYEYQSYDDCQDEMEKDFESIISAYKDNLSVNLDYKIHNAIKNIVDKQDIAASDIDKIEIIKDIDGNWKLCVLSGDKTLGEYEAFHIHNVR